MKRIFISFICCLFSFCVLSFAEESSEKTFNYDQKMLNREIKKDLKVKVAIYVPEKAIQVVGSPFNPAESKVKEGDKKIDVKLTITDGEEMIKRQKDEKLLTGLLTDKLSSTDKFIIVERKDINAFLREIDFEKSKWVAPESAAKLGNIYGVKYIIICELLKNQWTGIVSEETYTVTLRMTEVETGKVVASGTGKGFPIDEAISMAVFALNEKVNSQPWSCRIVKIEGDLVYLNAGFEEGLEKRMVFGVYKLKSNIVDPVTNKTLGEEKEKVGKIRITEIVNNDLAKAEVIEKTEPLKVDFIVQAKASTTQEKSEFKQWNKISEEGKDESKTWKKISDEPVK